MTALYECLTPGTDKWVECTTTKGCARTRRINKNLDPVLRLEQYKLKLDLGQELNNLEQQDLEEIAAHVKAVIESFINAVEEAFKPIIEAISVALRELWDSLPEEMKTELLKEATPRLQMTLNPEVFGDTTAPRSTQQGYIMPRIQGDLR